MNLKSLAQLRPDTQKTVIVNEDNEVANKNSYLHYFQQGYGDAKGALGNSTTLSVCLENVYQKFKQKCRADENEQQKLRAPMKEGKGRLESQLAAKTTLIELKGELLERQSHEIQSRKQDIASVKVQPEDFGIDIDKRPKAQFYIGLVILFFITLYLFVFYVSASYSSFFKDFDSTVLGAAIFDSGAFTKAFSDGWLEGMFVITLPFVFMGMGYLIHMFMRDNKSKSAYLKVSLLFLVTFIFDAILAYLIEQKIYNFEKTLDTPDFNLGVALGETEFWSIIFAGFLVYIIWGLVLDFVMKEHANLDKLQLFVKSKREEINNVLTEKKQTLELIDSIKSDIAKIKGELNELQTKLDGFIFPYRKYKVYHSEYVKGWFMGINKELALPHKEKDLLITDCENISNEHLERYDLYKTGGENTLYVSA